MRDVENIFGRRARGRQTSSHIYLILLYNINTHFHFPTFGLTHSFRDFVNLINAVDPHGLVVSYLRS